MLVCRTLRQVTSFSLTIILYYRFDSAETRQNEISHLASPILRACAVRPQFDQRIIIGSRFQGKNAECCLLFLSIKYEIK